jgi:hypothetical protein
MYEKFHWTAPSGDVITLPYLDKLKAGLLRRVRKLDGADAMFTILEEISDEETLAKIDDLENADLNKLAEAWQEAESMGESSGSSTSSTSTEGPSSTTSAPGSLASPGA